MVHKKLLNGTVIVKGHLGILNVSQDASEFLNVENLIAGRLLFFVAEVHSFSFDATFFEFGCPLKQFVFYRFQNVLKF